MKLVRKTLAKVADKHDEVISNTIEILLISFGDSSVDFELRCVVSNVDRHIQIRSDLYYAVEEALRENNITIPFPQRDLHFMSNFPTKKED